MIKKLSIGVVIPSYNEGQDLINTLRSIMNQTSSFAEIVVVDDSSDGTDKLVSLTFGEKVKLIHRERPLGRCSARNLGIKISTADVIVILNADVCLPQNFCEQLQKKYSKEECDALGVESVITNTEHAYARYLEAIHRSYPREKLGWTEGFSVRRSAFLKTRGFPDGYPLPILAGEDGQFVNDLISMGAQLCFDFDLKVTTVMPENWPTIESQIRGRASLRTLHFVYNKSLLEILIRSIIKQIRRLIILTTFIPFCWRLFWLWSHFNHGWKDLVNYSRYEFYVEWLRSHQEWIDLIKLFHLHKKNSSSLFDIFFKSPSELTPNVINK